MPARRGKPGWRRADLHEHVQVPVARPVERLAPGAPPRRSRAKRLGGRRAARAPRPGRGRPSSTRAFRPRVSSGRRVLGEHGERRHRARGDGVVGARALRRRPSPPPAPARRLALARPAAAARRSITSHLRAVDSIRSTWASGRATASARPGEARARADVRDAPRAGERRRPPGRSGCRRCGVERLVGAARRSSAGRAPPRAPSSRRSKGSAAVAAAARSGRASSSQRFP